MDYEGNSGSGNGSLAGIHRKSDRAEIRRKPRPSKARGLRTSTGCLTCRRRRVKCDELRPKCSQCLKSPHRRQCEYEHSIEPTQGPSQEINKEAWVDPQLEGNHTGSTIIAHKSSHEVPAFPYQPGTSILLEEIGDVLQSGQNTSKPTSLSPTVNNYEQSACDLSGNEGHGKSQRTLGLDVQTSIGNPLLSPVENEAPFNWYELLASDALGNFEKYSFLSHESRWEFNPASLLQQPSTHFRSFSHGTESRPEVGSIAGDSEVGDSNKPLVAGSMEPWNSAERLKLDDRETSLFQYFIETIGPLLDLYDPAFHFTNHVPHLAIYNTGLMKSILAVAAIHRSLKTKDLSSPAVTSPSFYLTPDNHLATQYYYETLNYLSQAMPYQTYAQSSEILATAILLGTYEMFDGSNRNWERHLKGTFWILRTQDIDGESLGLRRAAWWAWLRQDIWAAFRDKRRTLTIWQPTRPLDNLTGSDLACRSLYLLSKAVEYSSDEVKESQDMAKRLDEGNLLLYALEEWKNILPRSFFPLPVPRNLNSLFETIQIHPPAYAAAMQTYSFAKITVILNMPSSGGINEYHERQKVIDVAVNSICGIARSPKGSEIPLAFVSAQCLFSAGQCIRNIKEQDALLKVLEESIGVCKWPPIAIIDELKAIWHGI